MNLVSINQICVIHTNKSHFFKLTLLLNTKHEIRSVWLTQRSKSNVAPEEKGSRNSTNSRYDPFCLSRANGLRKVERSNGQYITNETRNQRQKQSTERLQSKVVHSVGAPAGFVYLEAFRIKRKSIQNLPHANRTCEFLRRLCLQSLGLDSFWSHHLQQYHEFKGAFGCQESWNTIFFFWLILFYV